MRDPCNADQYSQSPEHHAAQHAVCCAVVNSMHTVVQAALAHANAHNLYNIAYVRVHVVELKMSQLMGTSCISSQIHEQSIYV